MNDWDGWLRVKIQLRCSENARKVRFSRTNPRSTVTATPLVFTKPALAPRNRVRLLCTIMCAWSPWKGRIPCACEDQRVRIQVIRHRWRRLRALFFIEATVYLALAARVLMCIRQERGSEREDRSLSARPQAVHELQRTVSKRVFSLQLSKFFFFFFPSSFVSSPTFATNTLFFCLFSFSGRRGLAQRASQGFSTWKEALLAFGGESFVC
ncbi:hypothetical protein BJV74DRAFT_846081 [Russula compacta]|nr:hypothetical protein BJV74DRAFT_846081 [Russula compacta]